MKVLKNMGENLNKYLQQMLSQTFDKLKGNIRLYICGDEKSMREDFEWNDIANEDGEVCEEITTRMTDSRLLSLKIQSLAGEVIWVFLVKECQEPTEVLLKIVLEELGKRFTDFLHVEEVERILGQGEQRTPDEESIVKYFLGNLTDKEWLVNHYAERIVKEYGLPDWRLLVQISAQFYENRAVNTRLYFADADWIDKKKSTIKKRAIVLKDALNEGIKEDRRLDVSNLRTVRKLMEMAGENHGLLVDKKTYEIKCVINDRTDENPEICIEFSGHLRWKLMKNEGPLFEYRDGEYRIPQLEMDDEGDELQSELKSLGLDQDQITSVEQIIQRLKKQPHGTSIVFMAQTLLEKEIARLEGVNRAYCVEPFDILKQEEKIMGISSIDGALLANLSGTCYAVGALLDGEAVLPGKTSRGSRYNSLVNYVNWVKKGYTDETGSLCFSVILSEDHMVSLGVPSSAVET